MANHSEELDGVFHALANSTRREVIARLSHGPATMSALAAPFDMALPSLLAHLQVLEGAGLVRSNKVGRTRTFRLDSRRLIEAEHWIDTHRKQWEARLDQFDEFILQLKDNPK